MLDISRVPRCQFGRQLSERQKFSNPCSRHTRCVQLVVPEPIPVCAVGLDGLRMHKWCQPVPKRVVTADRQTPRDDEPPEDGSVHSPMRDPVSIPASLLFKTCSREMSGRFNRPIAPERTRSDRSAVTSLRPACAATRGRAPVRRGRPLVPGGELRPPTGYLTSSRVACVTYLESRALPLNLVSWQVRD